jgi:hypothetical protein
MASASASRAPQPRLLYSYIAQPQFYSDHHHPDRQNTPDGLISIAFTRSSRRSIHTNNDLVKGVVHVKTRLKIEHVTISFIGKTTCRIARERNPANQHISEVELFRREQTLARRATPSATCPPSRVEYPFEFRFPEAVENDATLQKNALFRPDTLFEHNRDHALPPSLWWNESTICNEYFLRAEFVTEQTSFTLKPVVIHQLRFSPSVPQQGLSPGVVLVPAPPIRFERRSKPSTPDPFRERRASLRRLKSGLRGGAKEDETSSTSLLVLSAPSHYRVGAASTIKLSLQATLSDGNTQPAPVYLRGIRAQVTAHINFRVPLASGPNGEIRKESIERFDLFNQRYSKPGIELTSDTTLEGFEIHKIVPPTFKTYGVALYYDVKYDLLLECAGKESEHEIDVGNVVIEPMTRPGGSLGPPEEMPPLSDSDESFVSEEMLRNGPVNVPVGEQPPPYYR